MAKKQSKSLDFMGLGKYTIHSNGTVTNTKTSAFMSTYINNSGYMLASLTNDDKVKVNKLMHVMVARAFLDNPENLSDVGHIDDNKLNVDVSNLEWTSHSDNIKKTYKNRQVSSENMEAFIFS